MYNKTVQQNILRNYYSNNLNNEPSQNHAQEIVGNQQQKVLAKIQTVQGHSCDFSPYLKQPPVYNPPPTPPAWSPLKAGQNGYIQNHSTAKCNLMSKHANLQAETPRNTAGSSGTSDVANTNLQVANFHQQQLIGTSPPLTAASQQLVMSLNDEFRASRVMKVQKEAADASQQEVLAALQATGWDTNQAAKQITRDRLAKIENLMR